MSAKRPSRELHDAFETDVDLDLTAETYEAESEAGPTPAEAAGAAETEVQRELIERVPPSQMIPDRFQPRPILPVDLQGKFFAGELDCYEVAGAWLTLAETDEGHRERVDELLAMAASVGEHGQIKPVTGSWAAAEGGGYLFQIETGERRFWGACLRAVVEELEDEPTVRVEAIEAPSVERQIIENRHAQAPTAVAQAREIAALLLSRMGIEPDAATHDPYEYFRLALDPPGRERLPRGIWGKLEPTMQLSQRRMRQVLSVLRLPTALLERADRYDLSDRVLQAVLGEPEGEWPALIEIAVDRRLTGDEVLAAAAEPQKKSKAKGGKNHARSALRGLRGFSGAVARAGGGERQGVLDEVADEIVVQDDAEAVVATLEELVGLLNVRLEAMDDD